jgi:hypothetical protein
MRSIACNGCKAAIDQMIPKSLQLCRCLELLGADASQMLMPTRPIVKVLDIVADVVAGLLTRVVDALLDALLFRLEKKDSATALSQQFPRRLMLGRRPFERQKRRQSSLPYCDP